jgi:ubiquitin carboxyl-terminal hydrolase L3
VSSSIRHSVYFIFILWKRRKRSLLILVQKEERAQWLYDNAEFEHYHGSVASLGDTAPPPTVDGPEWHGHFVAFVKGDDGHLYELEGSRKGPLDRGVLGDGEDVLSPRAIELGVGRIIKMDQESGGGDLRFSVTALAEAEK